MDIEIGIYTSGEPRLRRLADGNHLLENMLIGKDFHWERVIEAVLPGRVEIRDGQLVNILPVERYLECVVGSEMNPSSPIEFLKAHAIISRSWVVGKILRSHPEESEGKKEGEDLIIGWDDTAQHIGFHVCSDDHCQRYQGIQPVAERALEAIRSTAGIVIADKEGRVVDARFSKCCGGVTELFSTCWQDREMAGLESFRDPWCDLSDVSPEERERVLRSVLKEYDLSTSGGYRWVESISKKRVRENLLKKFGRDIGEIRGIKPVRRGPSGRISLLRVEGSDGSISLGKELWIRRLLSESHLYSSAFEIEDSGGSFILHGKGWGHGVGLCQIGAARMALAGADFASILRFYYPHTRLKSVQS